MGKRIEKAKDKAGVQAGTELQPYSCTGHFQTDFVELCRRVEPPFVYTPAVISRPRRPRSPVPVHVVEEKTTKPVKSSKKEEPEKSETPGTIDSGDPVERPPKTYTTKERFEYFKPCIQVEMDYPDKLDSVTEVYIRGWKIDEVMMNIFLQCWTTMTKLHTINLWSVGLTDDTLELFASVVHECVTLRILSLDNNRVNGEAWQLLMKDDCPVQHLSLRYNGITDVGAERIGSALGNVTQQNQKLLSLSLAGNKIGDAGARHLADGLRFNRCLLSLGLAYNCIGNDGAKSLAEVISRFPLKHEEIVARRVLLSSSVDRSSTRASSPSYRREKTESRDTSSSVRSSLAPAAGASRVSKAMKSKKGDVKTTKEEDAKHDKTKGKLKEAEKTAKRASTTLDTVKSVAKKPDKKGKRISAQNEPEITDITDAAHPLLGVVDSQPDGTVFVKGNLTLLNLNLAGNKIEESGAEALLHALKDQTTLSHSTAVIKVPNSGLMRLCIQRNKLPTDSGTVKLINAVMATRDPLQKPSSATDHDLQSFS